VEGLQAVLVDRQDEPGFLDEEGIRFVRHDGVSTRFPTTAVVFWFRPPQLPGPWRCL